VNEEAIASVGLQSQKKKIIATKIFCKRLIENYPTMLQDHSEILALT
jgi:hypothetical protein